MDFLGIPVFVGFVIDACYAGGMMVRHATLWQIFIMLLVIAVTAANLAIILTVGMSVMQIFHTVIYNMLWLRKRLARRPKLLKFLRAWNLYQPEAHHGHGAHAAHGGHGAAAHHPAPKPVDTRPPPVRVGAWNVPESTKPTGGGGGGKKSRGRSP